LILVWPVALLAAVRRRDNNTILMRHAVAFVSEPLHSHAQWWQPYILLVRVVLQVVAVFVPVSLLPLRMWLLSLVFVVHLCILFHVRPWNAWRALAIDVMGCAVLCFVATMSAINAAYEVLTDTSVWSGSPALSMSLATYALVLVPLVGAAAFEIEAVVLRRRMRKQQADGDLL